MERLGVETYSYDWAQSRGGSSCYVEMCYGASVYRFENSTAKSAESGRNLVFVSDLFAAVVYSLEGLARAVEQGIFTLDMLLTGVPALPPAVQLEPCFAALGFSQKPVNADEVKIRYRALAKSLHPDKGGSEQAFTDLTANSERCLQLVTGNE